MIIKRALAAFCVIAAGSGFLAAAGQEGSKPLTKAEIEQIVKDYIMQHPDVVLDSVRQYQERARADQRKRAQDAVTAKGTELYLDGSSPATVPAAQAGDAISMVEFFDYRCGYCKRVQPALKKVLADNPHVRLVFKEFPILGPESTMASKAALASVKQNKYVPFHDALMTSQLPLTSENIDKIAASVGIDVAAMKKDMESPEIEVLLAKNRELATALGVEATPSFVIAGEVVPGAIDASAFQQLIRKAESQKKVKQPPAAKP
jgi:protein-disulfide isomerase